MLKFVKYSLLILLIHVALYVTYFWGGTIYKTFHIVMNMSSDSPEWISDRNYEVELSKTKISENSNSEIHLYRPKELSKTSFVIFIPGFADKGAFDERVVRLSRSFAEAGIGVAVLETETMTRRIFNADDVVAISNTFNYLEQQEYVEDGKIAICGFSVAGSFSLIASSKMVNKPLFVLSFGGYFDLKELVTSIISEQVVYRGNSRRWVPSEIPIQVVSNLLGEELIEQEFGYEQVLKLLSNTDSNVQEIFKNLSPSFYIHDVESNIYIIHSSEDDSIPVEHSYMILDSLPGKTDVSFTELSNLSHVTPKDFFSYDYLKLSWQVLNMVRQLE